MKGDTKYIVMLIGAALIFVAVKLLTPKPVDWTITFSHVDKNPFGSYLVNERLTDLFPGREILHNNQTIYELQDSAVSNLLVLSERLFLPEEDTDALLTMVDSGANVFLAAGEFLGHIADTLEISAVDYFFNKAVFSNFNIGDTSKLTFVNKSLPQVNYEYARENTRNYFENFDSLKTTILAVNDLKRPVLIRLQKGKGNLFICSTPLAFTNNYLLLEDNSKFISTALSYLPDNDLVWTEYYQLGRMEPGTPLRVILLSEPLKWAFYLTLFTLIIFILFEAKRKQRIIPIITPLKNTTLEFIGTVSNLYFQKKDHKSIAEKRINFFLDKI
ncbi:MAG: DUF4350 domain-containing protein, partial [Bacteroidota bacterium]